MPITRAKATTAAGAIVTTAGRVDRAPEARVPAGLAAGAMTVVALGLDHAPIVRVGIAREAPAGIGRVEIVQVDHARAGLAADGTTGAMIAAMTTGLPVKRRARRPRA